ncbi:MAG TPA: GNAT family N-acetyltransferase [Blastocatellia bacterium]|nr:GNAT family N-acetyltransferase [Blastocatellia bacterium]
MTQITQISLKMFGAVTYELRVPTSAEEWQAHHRIRREVLFENRGQFGEYDENHPDEHREGNHPLLLIHNGEPIGVIRVDISGTQAIFRRVAIREDLQRSGHGRMLLALAESFAQSKGCNHISSEVAPDAVGFYQRCGYELVQGVAIAGTASMQKNLV